MEKSEALAWSGSVPWCRCSSKGRGDGTDSREHGGRARYTARPPAGERALNTASTAEKACECMRDYLLRACAVSHGHGPHLQSPDFDENFVSANVGHAISHSSARPLADHMPFAPPVCTNIHTLSSCTSSLGLAGSQCPCTGCMHSCIGAVVQLNLALQAIYKLAQLLGIGVRVHGLHRGWRGCGDGRRESEYSSAGPTVVRVVLCT